MVTQVDRSNNRKSSSKSAASKQVGAVTNRTHTANNGNGGAEIVGLENVLHSFEYEEKKRRGSLMA